MLIAPGNGSPASGEPAAQPVLIAPGNTTAASRARRTGGQGGVSIRPGAHRTGERGPPTRALAPSRFQSAPVLIAPGNGECRIVRATVAEFQSAPVLIAPGNMAPELPAVVVAIVTEVSIRPGAHRTGEPEPRSRSLPGCRSFNPPRCSSHRGTLSPRSCQSLYVVSIRPGAHRTGEPTPTCHLSTIRTVSIRPGAHRTGEHRPLTHAEQAEIGFNPPRCSSHRGTLRV